MNTATELVSTSDIEGVEPTKILYIAGWGRSGTTILDNLLGQLDGFVSTGELHYVWERGLLQHRDCGCGQPLRDCSHWRAIFERAFGGMEQVDPEEIMRAQRAVHTRHAAQVLRAVRRQRVTQDFAYASSLEKLYGGIAGVSGATVIVDSSKYPTDAIVAAGLRGYDVRVVHMVRDPRAVAFSWARKKVAKDKAGGLLRRVGLVRSTVTWQVYNLAIAHFVRLAVGPRNYLMVRYEDFATEPQEALGKILRLVGEPRPIEGMFQGNQVELKTSHTASGNPGRFRTGPTTIRLDSEWQESMPRWKRMAVTVLSFPLSFGFRSGRPRSPHSEVH